MPSIYYAHAARRAPRHGLLVPVTPLTPPRDGRDRRAVPVRFRTVGDITCTARSPPRPATMDAIIAETAAAHDHRARRDAHGRPDHEASMELRKKEGYF